MTDKFPVHKKSARHGSLSFICNSLSKNPRCINQKFLILYGLLKGQSISVLMLDFLTLNVLKYIKMYHSHIRISQQMLEPDENNQNREAKRQNIGRKIWTSMLDADLNARYWKYIGRKQFKRKR